MAELDSGLSTLGQFLSAPNGAAEFNAAVASAFKMAHGGSGARPTYNLDMCGHLAASIESYNYAASHMVGKPRFADRFKLLEFAVREATVTGPILEFGVWSGRSINHLATLAPATKLYGFDSFEGLPEAWFGKTGGIGQFSRNGEAPAVRENVELVIGWFDRMIPTFLDEHEFGQISILHIDCDIYSSTQTILSGLYKRIGPGTVIVFDEYFNYPTWQRHEFQAFQEFVAYRQVSYEYLGLVPSGEQVAVRVLSML